MKEKVLQILNKIPMPTEGKSLVEANVIGNVIEDDNELRILVELPQKHEKFKSAIVPTMHDILSRELDFSGEIKIEVSIIKLNDSKEPGGVSGVKHLIAVASGKGGVGKSTVSANLAISLAKQGLRVGLLDADIFGPSVPKMFGVEGQFPEMQQRGEKEFIIPIQKYGVSLLSVGFFVQPSEAVAWRGPMAGNVLKQLIQDADWGELDVLVFDMPPGTSDIQLTITQVVNLSGAVMVSTPQDVALIDVVRGIDFFQKEKIGVPIIGLVENMSWFTPAELPENKYYIFGKGGAEKLAAEKQIPFLGNVPIVQSIREGGDEGVPAALQEDSIVAKYFADIAKKVAEAIGE